MNDSLRCPFCWDKLKQAKEQAKLQRLLAASNLPLHYQDASFDNVDISQHPDTAKMLAAAKNYVESWSYFFSKEGGWDKDGPEPMSWLALFGFVGTGKTHLLTAITRALVEDGLAAEYWYVPDLLDRLRQSQFERDPSEDATEGASKFWKFMAHLKEITWLVLDDLGVEKMTDWAGEQLEKIIDFRYREEYCLVVATNLGMKDIRERMPRIADRLEDNGVCIRVTSKAPSYRKEKKPACKRTE